MSYTRCTLYISLYIWSCFLHTLSLTTIFHQSPNLADSDLHWLSSIHFCFSTFIAITICLKLLIQVDLNPWFLTVTILDFEPSDSLQWLEGLTTISLLSHHLSARWPVTIKASLIPNSDTQTYLSASRNKHQTTWFVCSAKSQLSILLLETDVTRS